MKNRKPLRVTGLGKVPRVYHEAWAVYEAFRKLGFTDDEVIAQVQPGFDAAGVVHENMFFVIVQAQGLSFAYTVMPIDRSFEKAQDYWKRFREAISKGTVKEHELYALWKSSEMGSDLDRFTTLATLMKAKGFRIPALES